MVRLVVIGAALALFAPAAMAAPDDETGRQAALAARFAPFDKAAEDGWAAATPEPLYLAAAADKAAAAPLTLQPGAYKVVVLCDCNMMEVTLVGPDNMTVPPERSDDHGAMYSLDVHAAGAYLTGIDMDDCDRAKCDVAVKVYRKKA